MRPPLMANVGFLPTNRPGVLVPCVVLHNKIFRVGDGVVILVDPKTRKLLFGVIRGFIQDKGRWMFFATWIKAEINPPDDSILRNPDLAFSVTDSTAGTVVFHQKVIILQDITI
jgi:hypothetical protein